MLDMLVQELGRVGLDLNTKKSKIFTLDEACFGLTSPLLIDLDDGFVEVVRTGEMHKYLGAAFPGDLKARGKTALAHRIKCAWGKFHLFHGSLTNRHVDIKLRLRLFDAVVTPCVMYGLATAPMTSADIEHLAATQRNMLRSIVGYVKGPTDTWADMHRRLNKKIADALAKLPIRMWAEELATQRHNHIKAA